MDSAILRVLRSSTGTTYSFPNGSVQPVDLICSGIPATIEEVLVDNTYAIYSAYAAGRVAALKITCGGLYSIVVLNTKQGILNLIECCRQTSNIEITTNLGDTLPAGSYTVYNVLGIAISDVTTPAQLVTAWNGDTENNKVGVLYEGEGWNFILKLYSGSYKPSSIPVTLVP